MNLENWTNRLAKITDSFQKDFGDLPEKKLNWKPNEETWSIAQNIDHLIVINSTYFPIFEALKNDTYTVPFTGKINFLVNLFGKKVLDAVQPTEKKKIKTFKIWQPSESKIGGNIFERFINHQAELGQHYNDCRAFIENGVIISSPANKYIVYKLETAFEIIVTHEERHLAQAQQITLPE